MMLQKKEVMLTFSGPQLRRRYTLSYERVFTSNSRQQLCEYDDCRGGLTVSTQVYANPKVRGSNPGLDGLRMFIKPGSQY